MYREFWMFNLYLQVLLSTSMYTPELPNFLHTSINFPLPLMREVAGPKSKLLASPPFSRPGVVRPQMEESIPDPITDKGNGVGEGVGSSGVGGGVGAFPKTYPSQHNQLAKEEL